MRFAGILLLIVLAAPSYAAQRLYSAVSPSFPDGLQSLFIRYIATQMGARPDIVPIPYARRLIALDQGKIDLMLGVSNVAPFGNDTVLLLPPYESLQQAIFVRSGDETLFESENDLRRRRISVTRYTNSDAILVAIPEKNIVLANSLQQKIDLLLKGRVEAFMHLEASTNITLTNQNLHSKIALARFQPDKAYAQYVAINKHSWLFEQRDKLQAIIKQGIKNGDFAHIRREYYQANAF